LVYATLTKSPFTAGLQCPNPSGVHEQTTVDIQRDVVLKDLPAVV
jgi:hypothetical protein